MIEINLLFLAAILEITPDNLMDQIKRKNFVRESKLKNTVMKIKEKLKAENPMIQYDYKSLKRDLAKIKQPDDCFFLNPLPGRKCSSHKYKLNYISYTL